MNPMPASFPLSRRALAVALAAVGVGLSPAALRAADVDAPAARDDSGATPRHSVFELGRIVVQATPEGARVNGEQTLDQRAMERLNLETVADAVAVLPGASLSHNSRNEAMVYLRGFDPRQVPVFLDGIPQYVPYDGYVDFDRFTTFDLAEIRVAKGAASLLYGPNTLGGAVNLVSRMPTAPFEGDVRVGAGSSGEYKAAVNLGMRQGDWYVQAGASWIEADGFPLPHGFRDYKAKPSDTGDERANADHEDRKLSLKLGWMPHEGDEYALGYSRQDGAKGNPVYTGRANQGIRYWRWPYWDKESVYFIGNQSLGKVNALRMRAYEDRYGNGLDAYTDARYATKLLNTSFPSVYADRTRGASIELVNTALANHELHVAAHYKEDRHRESNPLSPTKTYRDATTSIAAEDVVALGPDWQLRLGASREQRKAREVYDWPTGSTRATNALAELVHELGEGGGELYGSISHKTRFPTIKDRYSARMGRALPNPDLKPETARHLELGWRGRPWAGAHAEVALFESRIRALIQDALVPSDQCGGTVCNQAQNIGRARYRGVELSLDQRITESARVGLGYTWLDRDNLSRRDVPLTDSPRQRVFAQASWAFHPEWRLVADGEAEQGRMVASVAPGNRNGYLRLHGYASFGAKLVWSPQPAWELEAGGRNLGNRWYELSDGFPMPGRRWFANASYRF